MINTFLWVIGLFIFFWIAAILKIAFDPATYAESKNPKKAKEKPLIIPKRGLKIPAQIVYTGGSTPGGRRDILINSIADGFDAEAKCSTKIISTFCMTARETRHFRVDRIAELINMETGEIVSDPGRWIEAAIAERQTQRRAANAVRARQRRLERNR